MRKQEKRKKWAFMNIIKEHLENNKREYFIISIIFLIGIVIGVIFINNTSGTEKNQISEYINNFINSLKTDYTIDSNELLKKSIINNIILVILIWFMGMAVIGIPIVYAIIFSKAFSLGYTISSSVAVLGLGKGILFNIITLLFQNIIFVPCLISLGVSGMKLYKSIVKDRRRENIKIEIFRHTIFSLFIGTVLICSSFIEVYISSNLLQGMVNYF